MVVNEQIKVCDAKKLLRKRLGATIKKVRIESGLTQKKLSEMVGIQSAYLSQIETGHRSPSSNLLTKLASAFDTQASRLMLESELLNSGDKDNRVSLLRLLVKAVEQAPDIGRFIGSLSDAEALVGAMKNTKVR